MLPFDVDLASSGFTDGTGERTGVNEMKCARQFSCLAWVMQQFWM